MPVLNYEIDRRQFYIGQKVMPIGSQYSSVPIGQNLHLSYNIRLPVSQVSDTVGNQWTLVGDAFQSLPDKDSPLVELSCMDNAASLDQLYANWSGRWLLIGNDEVHTDASGLLGCYYRSTGNGIELSSSIHLLAGKREPETFYLLKRNGLEFYPLPDTGFHSIKQFFPSQILNLLTGEKRFRNLVCETGNLTYDQIVDKLILILTTTLRNAHAHFNVDIELALTAGYDSRTVMAALNYLEIPYRSFTLNSPYTSDVDISIPRTVSALGKINHRVIARGRRKIENKINFDIHTGYHSVERDRETMMYQQFNALAAETSLLLRANCFEVGRCAYYKWLPAELPEPAEICRILHGNEFQEKSLAKWIEWVKLTPQINLDWRDRYYLEERIAGWLASTEQGLDMMNIDRFIPGNSTLFYSLMLSIPEEIRKTKIHHTDMIKRMSPELLTVPFNPREGYLHRQYRRILFRLERLRGAIYSRLID